MAFRVCARFRFQGFAMRRPLNMGVYGLKVSAVLL